MAATGPSTVRHRPGPSVSNGTRRRFGRFGLNRIRQDRGLGLLTAAAMACSVVLVYALVVVGGGAWLGGTGSPSLWLSVLATAIVALTFEPAQSRIGRLLARAVHQDRASPYQVLAGFPSTVTGSYPAQQLTQRMARVLAEGTGAASAEIWLMVHGRLELAASWPIAAEPAHRDVAQGAAMVPPPLAGDGESDQAALPPVMIVGAQHSLAVRERGELLGALVIEVTDGQQLTPVEERLFAGLAAQSGLMLRVAGLRAELEEQLARLQRRTAELRRARRDLVDRQDAERQRLERNIHDGAQQEVIALLVNLRLAQTLLGRAPERGARLLAEQAAAVRSTIDTLTALSRGLYPRLLTDEGPVAALAAAVSTGPIPVTLLASGVPRCTAEIEAAVYFSCLEAVQNATKHSGASAIVIDIRLADGTSAGRAAMALSITDDGAGFDLEGPTGRGLANIRDRIESVQGAVEISSTPGRGTVIRAELPAVVVTAGAAPRSATSPPDIVRNTGNVGAADGLTGAPVSGR